MVSKSYTLWIWESKPYKILMIFQERIWYEREIILLSGQSLVLQIHLLVLQVYLLVLQEYFLVL